MGFDYERNLPHQSRAIASICGIFEESECKEIRGEISHLSNPLYTIKPSSIKSVQR